MQPGSIRIPFGKTTLPLGAAPPALEPVAPPAPARPRPGPIEDEGWRPEALEEFLAGARSVAVVLPDATRRTGLGPWMAPLWECVRRTGGRTAAVIGNGLHRPPRAPELEVLLGAGRPGRLAVHPHDASTGAFAHLGTTRRGTPVRLNRMVVEADRRILVGAVGFHYFAGFTGGRKALLPGVAAQEAIAANHLLALDARGRRRPEARAGVLDGNPVHEDMLEAARLAGPSWVVNSVLGDSGQAESLWCGPLETAHRRACARLLERRRLRLCPRELVVAAAGGYPTDLDLIQAHKAFEAAFPALQPGGTFVLVAACDEGAGHPDFTSSAVHEPDAIARALRDDYRVYRQTAMAWRHKAARCRLILVSRLPADFVRKIGARPARDLDEAWKLLAAAPDRPASGWLFTDPARYLVESMTQAPRMDP